MSVIAALVFVATSMAVASTYLPFSQLTPVATPFLGPKPEQRSFNDMEEPSVMFPPNMTYGFSYAVSRRW